MTRTLIRGGCVLTMGRANHVQADVLIDGDVIAEVGIGLRARDAVTIDAEGCIVMPGFVDTHRHARDSLFRNLGDGAGTAVMDHGSHFRPGDLYAATLIGLLGAVDAGITTVVDWCDLATDPVLAEAALQAHADSGARSVFVHAAAPWLDAGWRTSLERAAGRTGGDRVVVAAGATEPSADGGGDEEWAFARGLGLRVHAHSGMAKSGGGAVAAMADRGLLGPDATLTHCTHASAADLDALAATHTGVSLTPSSEMATGMGTPPIQGLIDRGIRPGLGTDTERLAPGDAFAPMRAMISVQHATVFDRKLAGKAGLPKLLTTREVIRHATVDGAQAIGLGDVTGSLEPGRQADVVILRADRPNIHPVNDPIGAVVWGMDTSNVDWVLASGRVLKSHGELHADVAGVRSAADEARRHIAAAIGMESGVRR